MERKIKFGVIADPQYQDKDMDRLAHRDYRGALDKVREAVHFFNSIDDLDFVIVLGDLVDDSEMSFGSVMNEFKRLKLPFAIVPGNHDFKATNLDREKVRNGLKFDEMISGIGATTHNEQEMYYSFKMGGYRLVCLDTNSGVYERHDESAHDSPIENKIKADSPGIVYNLIPNHIWNGRVDKEQQGWLKNELAMAETTGERVLVFSHAPFYPQIQDMVINYREVLTILERYKDVVVGCFAGHHHFGAFAQFARLGVDLRPIPFITFKGMVMEGENAFAVVAIDGENIKVQGFGRENSYQVKNGF